MKNYDTGLPNSDGSPCLVIDVFETAIMFPDWGPNGPVGLTASVLGDRMALLYTCTAAPDAEMADDGSYAKLAKDAEIDLPAADWIKLRELYKAARFPTDQPTARVVDNVRKALEKK